MSEDDTSFEVSGFDSHANVLSGLADLVTRGASQGLTNALAPIAESIRQEIPEDDTALRGSVGVSEVEVTDEGMSATISVGNEQTEVTDGDYKYNRATAREFGTAGSGVPGHFVERAVVDAMDGIGPTVAYGVEESLEELHT